MKKFHLVLLAATLAVAGASSSALAKGKEAAPEKSVAERAASHPDRGVVGRIAVETGRFAAGVGSAVGAGVGIIFTPSKIGCGKGETCR